MAIHTQQSLSGFIASEPKFGHTEAGDAHLYVRIGQEHFRRDEDGTFTELNPTFHDLVVYRATAERAQGRFAKGDRFVAEGYVHTYPVERDGQTVESEEFVAKKIGHDLARTNYEVDRARRSQPSAGRQTPTLTEPPRASVGHPSALSL